ncbi:hypothetical protein A2U01_0115958, partial [Trifolium medium]|nr:hypothetical protein [Trifolium medium]
VAQMRSLSGHCPLILSANEENWGPPSFKDAEVLVRRSGV